MSNKVQLPETGFLRLSQIVGNPKATPPAPPFTLSANLAGGLVLSRDFTLRL